MTVPNFFQGMTAAQQVYVLGDLLNVASGDRNDNKRGDNVVFEIVNVLKRFEVPLAYVGEKTLANGRVKHLVVVTDPADREQWVTRVFVEATRGADDTTRKFRVTLKSDVPPPFTGRTEVPRHYNDVDDFKRALLTIALIAKSNPGRPVAWADVKKIIRVTGLRMANAPWTDDKAGA